MELNRSRSGEAEDGERMALSMGRGVIEGIEREGAMLIAGVGGCGG